MYNYTSCRISELWPCVAKIEINAKQTYTSAFGVFTDDKTGIFKPDYTANFHFKCRNNDCTAEYFDLYDVVASMVAHRQPHSTGTLWCRGHEAKDHDNNCPCRLDYEIVIDYDNRVE